MGKVFGGSLLERNFKSVREAHLKKQSEQLMDQDIEIREAAARKIWHSLRKSPKTTLVTLDNLYSMMGILDIDLINSLEHKSIYRKAIRENSGLKVEFLASHSQELNDKRNSFNDYNLENAEDDELISDALAKGKSSASQFLETTEAYLLYQDLLREPKIASKFTAEELLTLALNNNGAASAIFFQDEKLVNSNELGIKVAAIIDEHHIAAFLNKVPEEDDPRWENYFPTALCFFLKNCPDKFEIFCEASSTSENAKTAYAHVCEVLFDNIIKPNHFTYRPDIVEQIKDYPALLLLLAKHQDPDEYLSRFTSLMMHATKPADFLETAMSAADSQDLKGFISENKNAFITDFELKLQLKLTIKAISKVRAKQQFENMLVQMCLLTSNDINSIIELMMRSSNPSKLLGKIIAQDRDGRISGLINENIISFMCDFKAELKKNSAYDNAKRKDILDEMLKIELNDGLTMQALFRSKINEKIIGLSQLPATSALDFENIDAELRGIIPVLEDGYFSKKINLRKSTKRTWLNSVQSYTLALASQVEESSEGEHAAKLLFLAKIPNNLTKQSIAGDFAPLANSEVDIQLANRYFETRSEIANSPMFRKNFYKTYVENKSLTFEMASLIRRDTKLFAKFKSEQSIWAKIKSFFGFSTNNKKSVALIKQIVKQDQAEVVEFKRACDEARDDEWLEIAEEIKSDLINFQARAEGIANKSIKKKIQTQLKLLDRFITDLSVGHAGMSDLSALHAQKEKYDTALERLNNIGEDKDSLEILLLKLECKSIKSKENKQEFARLFDSLISLEERAQALALGNADFHASIKQLIASNQKFQQELNVDHDSMHHLATLRQHKINCETAVGSLDNIKFQRERAESIVLRGECKNIRSNQQVIIDLVADLKILQARGKEFGQTSLDKNILKALDLANILTQAMEPDYSDISDIEILRDKKIQYEETFNKFKAAASNKDEIEKAVLKLECEKYKKLRVLSDKSFKKLDDIHSKSVLLIRTLSASNSSLQELAHANECAKRLEQDISELKINIRKNHLKMTLNQLQEHKVYCEFAGDRYREIEEKLSPLHQMLTEKLTSALHANKAPVASLPSSPSGYYATRTPVDSAPGTPQMDYNVPQSSLPVTPNQLLGSITSSPSSQMNECFTPVASDAGTPMMAGHVPQDSLPGTPVPFIASITSSPSSQIGDYRIPVDSEPGTPIQIGTPSSITPSTPSYPRRRNGIFHTVITSPLASSQVNTPISSETGTPSSSILGNSIFTITPSRYPIFSEPATPVCSNPSTPGFTSE